MTEGKGEITMANVTILDNPTAANVKAASPKTPTIISKATVDALIQAQVLKTEMSKACDKAEKEFKKQLVSLFNVMFGVKTEDEIKSIDPEMLKGLFAAGMDNDFVLEPGADFQIALSKSARYPSWKDELIKLTSEAKAAEITQNTPLSYSYKVQKSE
jgi:hypothetical protein